MAHVEDRWYRKVIKDGKPVRVKTARYGEGLRYRVRYVADKRERSRSFAQLKEAEAYRDTVAADLRRNTWIDPDLGATTLRDYANDHLASLGGEATTRERVRFGFDKHILPGLGHYPLGRLAQRPSIINDWVNSLPLSANYARTLFSFLSGLLERAVDDSMIPKNPCKVRSVRMPRVDKRRLVPWEPGQVAAVREALPPRYRALADAGSGLGLRQGEAFGLSLTDIDWLRGIVHVRRQVRIVRSQLCYALPKGRRERDVLLPASVKERLAAHLAGFPAVPVALPLKEPGGKVVTERLIFTSAIRTVPNRSYFNSEVWKPALRVAGLPDDNHHGFHALRHFYAAMCLLGGVDIRTLAEYLGHSDPSFTLRVYGHFVPGGSDTVRKVIDNLLSPTGDGPATSLGAENT